VIVRVVRELVPLHELLALLVRARHGGPAAALAAAAGARGLGRAVGAPLLLGRLRARGRVAGVVGGVRGAVANRGLCGAGIAVLRVFFYETLGFGPMSGSRADLTVLDLFVSFVVWVAGRAGALLPRQRLLFRSAGVVLTPYRLRDHVHVGSWLGSELVRLMIWGSCFADPRI
jgi:hypothetical protein